MFFQGTTGVGIYCRTCGLPYCIRCIDKAILPGIDKAECCMITIKSTPFFVRAFQWQTCACLYGLRPKNCNERAKSLLRRIHRKGRVNGESQWPAETLHPWFKEVYLTNSQLEIISYRNKNECCWIWKKPTYLMGIFQCE